MKHRPLAVQISLVFVVITLVVAVTLGLLYISSLRSFFTEKIYENIESAQEFIEVTAGNRPRHIHFLELEGVDEGRRIDRRANGNFGDGLHWSFYPERSLQPMLLSGTVLFSNIRHMLVSEEISSNHYLDILGERLDLTILHVLREEALGQQADIKRYQRSIGDRKLFYVIRRVVTEEDQFLLVSLVWDEYKTALELMLFRQLLLGTVIALAASVFLAVIVSKYLTKPLVLLTKDVGRIAEGDWRGNIRIARGDEIGELGKSIETMRQMLAANEASRQASLQYISHELKTPVMVVRSFIQSIRDGIYPKGSLNSSLDVIDSEALRLEQRILDLLYFSKIDYMSKCELVRTEIQLTDLIKQVVDKYRYQRSAINWSFDLQSISIIGDPHQWSVVLENILDNQVRYAQTCISITLHNVGSYITLKIENDGPQIQTEMLKNMFTAYTTGPKGKTGLGLAIVKRILELHQAKISVRNLQAGVSFAITIQK